MQDWVTILRTKLHELRIVSRGENVYGAPPVAPAPRAAARDPTSPLPPTPPVPPDRVPGIDLTPISRPAIEGTQTIDNPTTTNTTTTSTATNQITATTQENTTTPRTTANSSNPSLRTTSSFTTNLNITVSTPNLTTFTSTTANLTALTNATSNLTTFTNTTASLTGFTNTGTNLTGFTNSSTNLTGFTNSSTNLTGFTNSSTNLTGFTNSSTNLTGFASATNSVSLTPINTSSVTTFANANANLTTFTNATTTLTNDQSGEVDISNWEPYSLPSTSRDSEPKQSVAKICGQNICLDDSILKRNVTDSDEEFFAEIDRIHDSAENISEFEFKQRVVVSNGNECAESEQSTPHRTNITVIQVSNKGPPHTAIPVLGPETDVFDFEFKQKLTVSPEQNKNDFINIVNTENDNRYGTVFDKTTSESDYGHISLTTTVSLTGDVKVTDAKDGVYERLCMASTSNKTSSPLPLRNVKIMEKMRKSSLPNLDVESDYEYLFPNSSQNNRNLLNSSEVNSNLQNGRNLEEILPNGRNGRLILPSSRTNQSNSREIIPNGRNAQTNLPNNRELVPNGRNAQTNLPISREILPNGRNTHGNPANGRNDANATNSESRVNISNISAESIARTIRSNVERSHSQNAYDIAPRQRQSDVRRVPNNSPKREPKIEKSDPPPKPIWRRGLTELSLLSRLRGIGQSKRQESPTRQECDDRGVTSPVKVVHRSRPAGRVDGTRRRSNSLTNSQSPSVPPNPALQPLRARQAAALRAEQRRGACAATTVPVRDPPLLIDYERQVWVARWGMGGSRGGGRAGDRVSGLAGTQPCSATHARHLLKTAHTPIIDVLFHRVPLGKIYVINKIDQENLGIKLDNECTIVSVDGQSPAGKAGLPPAGKWAVTEVNNRPINLLKGGEDEMNRMAMHGSEVSILIQPAPLVKKIRAAIKGNKPLLAIR
ncbi:DEP domain-containing protein DDB_G0279099 isoform X2 [Pararge aegeria]|nr:DEP domain-containing protein DDB_G0279099 isoform X2 [Pararge aegeria]